MCRFALLLLLSLPACAQSTLLDEAFQKIYSADYAGAQSAVGKYIAEQPHDPLGYAAMGSVLLFGELDRLGLLESEFFESNHKVDGSRKNLRPDKQTRDRFYAAVNQAQELAQAVLDKHPDDEHALFAMSLSLGDQVDYLALIEKKQIASLSVNKRAYREAKHLLKVDPHYTDAYLTTGFTEYLVGTLPLAVRWFVKFDDVQGNKDEGFRNLRLVADHGHYLMPLGKILLATGYLREKRLREARTLLAELTREYPANPLLKREYDRVSSRLSRTGSPAAFR